MRNMNCEDAPKYKLRRIHKEEISALFQLILERMKWMDEVGIEHWNKYEYDKMFPMSYYEEKCDKGEVYVLVSEDAEEIVAGAVLKEQDDYWKDNEPAYYVHNFGAKLGYKGVGSIFLEEVEKLAAAQGKRYVRADVLTGNDVLANYYGSRGYGEKGQVQDGNYSGVLWEKEMKNVAEG